MIWRIAGGLFLLFYGLTAVGVPGIPTNITGILGIIAGIALLAGM